MARIRSSQPDRLIFEQVFVEEHVKLLRLATLLLGSQALAEEAVQDVFARLLDRFETIQNPGGFVYTATVNRCRDIQRSQTRRRRFLIRFRPTELEQPGPDPLDDVLARLPRQWREIIVLRYYAGLSTREVAQTLDIPEGTVRSGTHRALKQLRKELST